MAISHYKENATLMGYRRQSHSLVNGLTKLVNIDGHELSRISTVAIGHDVRLGHDVHVLRREDGNRLNRRGLTRLLLGRIARLLILAARVELNVIVEVCGSLNHHDELASKNDAAGNRKDDHQKEDSGNDEGNKIRCREVRISALMSSGVRLLNGNVLDVSRIGLIVLIIEGLRLLSRVMHLVLHLLVLLDVDPSEKHNKGENSEEEDDKLNELEDPIEADQSNATVGGTAETNIEDDDVDEGIHEDNERHRVVEDVVE
jgi:hypothetical protein